MQSSKKLANVLRDFLDESIEQAEIDWLICSVTNRKRNELLHGFDVLPKDVKKVFKLARKRSLGIPLSQVLGNANFYGFDFKINKNVLIPRFETELLVETVIKNIPEGKGLDIGTGSGAIAITLNKLKNYEMTAVDLSRKALKLAKTNAKLLNVEVKFLYSDLFSNVVQTSFDFIVSNPPYIRSADIPKLQKEVKDHEPHLALDGGIDGLDYYRKIIEFAPKFLNDNGKIFFEIGYDQSKSVKELLEKNFDNIVVVKDYSQIDRIIYATIRR